MKIIAFILAFFASSVFAQDAWFEVVHSADSKTIVYGKGMKKTQDGAEMLLKWEVKNEPIEFYIASVSAKHCNTGYGDVAYMSLSRRLIDRQDYVRSGGTMTSEIGDWLCLFVEISKTTKGKNL
jgi:hypothetical protein